VAAQEGDPDSMLTFFRRLTALRRAEPALNRGAYEAVELEVDDVLAYRRTAEGGDSFLVVLNLGRQKHVLDIAATDLAGARLMLSTEPRWGKLTLFPHLALGPDEGVILRLEGNL
jgi:alpha-glucosidase